jgi:twitching motility two-component system response regulator PilH
MAKILAIDDSTADLKLMESLLSSRHMVRFSNGGEGVEDLVRKEMPDLILLDIVMPGRNGYDILRKLRRDDNVKNIPVIIISSKSEPTDVEWGRRQGANGYITKPYTSDSLINAIDGVLGR